MSVKALQEAALKLGYHPGPVDGIRGSRTQKAVSDWLSRKPFTAKRNLAENPERLSMKSMQMALFDLGYDPGPIDGLRGPKTEKAAKDWLGKKPLTVKQQAIEIPWVTKMMEVFGLHEARDNTALRKWLRSDGKTLGDPAKLPWCGDGMDTALWLALPDEPRPGVLGENPYWALNWGVLGVKCDLCYGAIASFQRQGGGHVGILDGQDATHLRVLGCNQSDSCGFTWIAKSQLKAVRWPSTFSNPNIPLPFKKRDGTPAKSSDLA